MRTNLTYGRVEPRAEYGPDARLDAALYLLSLGSERHGDTRVVPLNDGELDLTLHDDELEARFRPAAGGRDRRWHVVLPISAAIETVLAATHDAIHATSSARRLAHVERDDRVNRLPRLIARLGGDLTAERAEALAYRCWCDDGGAAVHGHFERSRHRALAHAATADCPPPPRRTAP